MYKTLTIAGNEYKLRLTASSTIELEKKLGGKNPILVLTQGMVPVTEIIAILHAAMQKFNHGISHQKVVELYDLYIEDGGTYFELLDIVSEVLEVSGFLTAAPQTEQEKEKE